MDAEFLDTPKLTEVKVKEVPLAQVEAIPTVKEHFNGIAYGIWMASWKTYAIGRKL
jgi:hypothetical protein